MEYVRFPARIPFALVIISIACTHAIATLASASPAQSRIAQPVPIEEAVDINTATLDQLIKVPGMTRTWAARIIRFRPYRAKNELLDRGIVSAEVYARIKDHIIAHRSRN